MSLRVRLLPRSRCDC